MKIPKTIHLAGHKIPVHIDAGVDSDAVGQYHAAHNQIGIRSGIPQSAMEEVLFHEVVEAINHIYELNLPHAKIQTLGAALHQAFGPLMK